MICKASIEGPFDCSQSPSSTQSDATSGQQHTIKYTSDLNVRTLLIVLSLPLLISSSYIAMVTTFQASWYLTRGNNVFSHPY